MTQIAFLIFIKVNIVIISSKDQFSGMTKMITDITVFYFALRYYDSVSVISWQKFLPPVSQYH